MSCQKTITLSFLIVVAICAAFSQSKKVAPLLSLGKTSGAPARTWLNINQLSTAIRNTGCMDNANDGGLTYPKGSGKGVTWSTSLMWSYRLRSTGEIQAGGAPNPYGGMQPGKVLPGGVPEDPTLPKNRIYRVRPDIPPDNSSADIRSELQGKEGTADEIYTQYHKDWLEWPASDGAPFTDVNGNGVYDPSVDIPGVQGADQSLWFVCNDVVIDYGWVWCMKPIGVELQVTCWAYNRQDALGYMYFTRFLIINKGHETLDSAYVTTLCDPDLGDYSDDLIGSDTTRSMVYDYNGRNFDQVYAPLPPPAFGIDFFQGPMVSGAQSDSALFKNTWVRGKRNLPMTASFAFNFSGDALFGDINWSKPPLWMGQVYNLCRGLTRNGQVIIDPRSGKPTNFRFAGDPEKRTGWIDGVDTPPGDRRMGMASGPFTMAPGDTQEVVTAEIVAGALQGGDQLTAVHLLKQYDDVGQKAYNTLFNLPTAPPLPKVTVAELDRELILTWGDDPQAVKATEAYSNQGFGFQGYNVYQFPTENPVTTSAKKLATYDLADGVTKIVNSVFEPSVGMLVPTLIQEGTDSGVKRSIHLKTDVFNGDNQLVNGKPYYFAVTSYGYNPDSLANPSALENPFVVIKATPHTNNPGTRYSSVFGDTVRGVVQTTVPGSAPSDGRVTPLVVDPTKVTGHTYQVSFKTVAGQTAWSLTDQTLGKPCLSGETNQSGDDTYLMTDGLLVKVIDVPPGMKSWTIPSGTRRFSPVSASYLGLEGFGDVTNSTLSDRNSGTIGIAANFIFGGIGTNLTATQCHTILLKLAAVDRTALWNPKSTPTDQNFSRAYRWLRSVGTTSTPQDSSFAPWIVKKGSGYPYQDYNFAVPFSAWDMSTTPPTRLSVGILENNVVGGLIDGRYWPPVANVGDNGVSRELCFIFAKPYTDTSDPSLTINLSNSVTPMMWVMTCTRESDASWAAGDQIQFEANAVNTPSNVFTFTAPQNTISDVSLAKDDVKQINVFPNPYYGVNPQETKTTAKFMTFSHLPVKARIRIFNMGGVMVRRLDKDSPSQFLPWDLRNEYGLLVGSGLYIAYIEMPDIGAAKTLKLAIVQEQQVLE